MPARRGRQSAFPRIIPVCVLMIDESLAIPIAASQMMARTIYTRASLGGKVLLHQAELAGCLAPLCSALASPGCKRWPCEECSARNLEWPQPNFDQQTDRHYKLEHCNRCDRKQTDRTALSILLSLRCNANIHPLSIHLSTPLSNLIRLLSTRSFTAHTHRSSN